MSHFNPVVNVTRLNNTLDLWSMTKHSIRRYFTCFFRKYCSDSTVDGLWNFFKEFISKNTGWQPFSKEPEKYSHDFEHQCFSNLISYDRMIRQWLFEVNLGIKKKLK